MTGMTGWGLAARFACRFGAVSLLLVLAAPGAAGASEVGCPARLEAAEAQATPFDGAPAIGACSLPLPPVGLYAAVSDDDWAGSEKCGRCLRVTGPHGEATVIVTERCFDCPPGALELSETAFLQIANATSGIVPIAWETVACDVGEQTMQLEFEGSNPYYLKVQVQRHRHGIAAVSFHDASTSEWTPMRRTGDNHFEVTGGGPYTMPLRFRIEDVHGQVVETQDVPEIVNATPIDAGVQLQPCPEPGAAGAAAALAALAGLATGGRARRARRL